MSNNGGDKLLQFDLLQLKIDVQLSALVSTLDKYTSTCKTLAENIGEVGIAMKSLGDLMRELMVIREELKKGES